MIIEVLAVSYFIAFAVLVVRGREREWPNEFGFLYSRDEVRNRAGTILPADLHNCAYFRYPKAMPSLSDVAVSVTIRARRCPVRQRNNSETTQMSFRPIQERLNQLRQLIAEVIRLIDKETLPRQDSDP
jgi:hypothetical protein